MTVDLLLRLFVYGLTAVVAIWAICVSWLVTRAAWRRVARPQRIADHASLAVRGVSDQRAAAVHAGPRQRVDA